MRYIVPFLIAAGSITGFGLGAVVARSAGPVPVTTPSTPAPPPAPAGKVSTPQSPAAQVATSSARPGPIRELFQPLVVQSKVVPESEAGARQASASGDPFDPDGTGSGLLEPFPEEDTDGDQAPELLLEGVVVRSGGPLALLRDTEKSVSRYVREGEEFGGYEVQEIATRHVLVQGPEEEEPVRVEISDEVPLEILGGGSLTSAELRMGRIPGLPGHLQTIAIRLLPRDGEIQKVETERDDGQTLWELEKRVEGRLHELRLTVGGSVNRYRAELAAAEVPTKVRMAAERTLPDFVVNQEGRHRTELRNGRQHYDVELESKDEERRMSVRVASDGAILRVGQIGGRR